MKKGRVVILLAGRLSGKKAIIIKQNDEGKKVSRFPPSNLIVFNLCFLSIEQKVPSRPCLRSWARTQKGHEENEQEEGREEVHDQAFR